ncbi:MAG: FAD-dependent oxidoreductase [Acidobacteriota bacterium]
MKNHYDVIVAGAGIAGVSAAIAASRAGASTLLVERYGFVGGMSTAGLVSPFMKYWIQRKHEAAVPLVGGIFEEINLRMASLGGMLENGFSAAAFKQAVNEMLSGAGADCALHSIITNVHRQGNRIVSIEIQNGAERATIGGTVFIDTTGDADLVFMSGAPYVKGDEKTGFLQAMTTFFRVGGFDAETAVKDVAEHPDQYYEWSTKTYEPGRIISIAGYTDIVRRAKERGDLPEAVNYLFFCTLPGTGETSFNTTNVLGLDGSSSVDLTQAEIEGRRQVMKAFHVIKQECPGFGNSFLIETGVQIGVRETRRAVGEYAVTGSDVRGGAKFPDAIARGNYGVDIHGQKGEDSVMEYLEEGEYYEVPLRALIVKEVGNLLTAGRSISSTREGHAALRIQATASATGEAAGVLASLARMNAGDVRGVPHEDVRKILHATGNI